ncbi:MAG: hypothetical protein KJ583_02660, partial [Nanoarchaeota archaeon]|nr:hypothetical protein [Nanoarchaeota archaeon]
NSETGTAHTNCTHNSETGTAASHTNCTHNSNTGTAHNNCTHANSEFNSNPSHTDSITVSNTED